MSVIYDDDSTSLSSSECLQEVFVFVSLTGVFKTCSTNHPDFKSPVTSITGCIPIKMKTYAPNNKGMDLK